MFKKIMSIAALFFAASFGANAALVTVQSADIDRSFTVTDLAAYWANITPSTPQMITLPTGFLFNGSGNNNSIYKLTATFTEDEGSLVSFDAGLDAGYGAEVFVNGQLVFNTESNLWWSRNWNSNAVISLVDLYFGPGQNVIEVYWAEDGNSGGNSFRADVRVSAPAILSIFALGLAGLAFTRRK